MEEIVKIPKGLLKVDLPDHPFTYDGPDTLISDRNGLLAIFQVRKNEMKNVNKLFSRLTNTLIAYPAFTKMILLYNPKKFQPNAITQFGRFYFNEFIELKDIRRAKSLIRDKKEESKIKEIQHVQKKLFAIQSQVQRDNLEYFNKSMQETRPLTQIPSLQRKASYWDRFAQKETVVRANIFQYENQFIGIKNLSSGQSDLADLRPFFEFVINSEFVVDNGVPYFKYLTRKALNVSAIPKIKYDPLKPTRIASLFGWHLTNSNEIEQITTRISKFIK